MLDEQSFRQKADDSLAALNSALLHAADEFGFEVDFNSGALSVEFDEPPAKFVISPNTPPRQIWVSAHSKSFKLDWDEAARDFVYRETGQTLRQLMAEAVSRQLDEDVEL